jgi:Mrp family chromosome partitioning ATPase
VLAVADASIMAPLVDGTIYVIDAESCSRSAMIQARDHLMHAGARLVGGVYNNFDPSQRAAYPYYYNHYYEYYGTSEDGERGVRQSRHGHGGRRGRRQKVKTPQAGKR